jgi:hypothetical protein
MGWIPRSPQEHIGDNQRTKSAITDGMINPRTIGPLSGWASKLIMLDTVKTRKLVDIHRNKLLEQEKRIGGCRWVNNVRPSNLSMLDSQAYPFTRVKEGFTLLVIKLVENLSHLRFRKYP